MMTEYSTDEFDRAKAQMGRDLNAAISRSQDSLKAAAPYAGARTKLEVTPAATVAEASHPAVVRARSAGAAAADDYVRQSPWIAVGIAAAAGMLIGLLAARR